MPKFDIKEHQKRMRELLKPKGVASPLADRIRAEVKKRRLPQIGA